jgi:hypothetical protein
VNFLRQEKIAAGMPQGSVLVPVLYRLYINNATATPGTHLALFVDDICIYETEKHERHVLCKLQRDLTAVNSWCERWNMKINEGEFRRYVSPEDLQSLTKYYT